MTETEAPPMGHNNPPPSAYDADAYAAMKAIVQKHLDAGGVWIRMKDIQTEQQSQELTDFITGLRETFKAADKARAAAKKPHDDLSTLVQKAYVPLLEAITKTADILKPMQARWLTKKAEEERAKKAKEDAEAAEAKAQAEKDAAAAAQRGDIMGQVEAEEAAKAADEKAKEAAKPVSKKASSASGGGRAMSLRKVRSGRIVNINKAFMHFREDPQVVAAIQAVVDAAYRAAGGDKIEIPGCEMVEREVAA